MAHYPTNRGLLRLVQGKWDDTGATTIKAGLLNFSATPAALTKAAIADVNFVSDLLALTGVVEMTASGYVRQTITRTAASEDDTNDRVNLDASDVTFPSVATGQNAGAAFYFIETASSPTDANREVLSVDIFTSTTPTNGSQLVVPIADLYRLA